MGDREGAIARPNPGKTRKTSFVISFIGFLRGEESLVAFSFYNLRRLPLRHNAKEHSPAPNGTIRNANRIVNLFPVPLILTDFD